MKLLLDNNIIKVQVARQDHRTPKGKIMKTLKTIELKDIYEANRFLYEAFDWRNVIACLTKDTQDTFNNNENYIVSGEYTTLVVNQKEIVVIPTETSLRISKDTKKSIIEEYGEEYFKREMVGKIDKTQPLLIILEAPINFESLGGGK